MCTLLYVLYLQMSEEDELNLLSLVTANRANSSIMILSLCNHYDLITKVTDDCGHITRWLCTIYQWICWIHVLGPWMINMLIWTSICSIIKLKNTCVLMMYIHKIYVVWIRVLSINIYLNIANNQTLLLWYKPCVRFPFTTLII